MEKRGGFTDSEPNSLMTRCLTCNDQSDFSGRYTEVNSTFQAQNLNPRCLDTLGEGGLEARIAI